MQDAQDGTRGANISIGLSPDELIACGRRAFAAAPKGSVVEVLVRLGVMLFSGIDTPARGPHTPASFTHLQPRKNFQTQFSQYLKTSAAESFKSLLRREGFKVLRDSGGTTLHLRAVDRDSTRIAGKHSGYVVYLAHSRFDIEGAETLPRVECIRSAMKRLLNVDVCMLELAMALRIAVSSGVDCAHERAAFRTAWTRRTGTMLDLGGDHGPCNYTIGVVRYVKEQVWSDGELEIKITQVEQRSDLHAGHVERSMEVDSCSPALNTALRASRPTTEKDGLFRFFLTRIHGLVCQDAWLNVAG